MKHTGISLPTHVLHYRKNKEDGYRLNSVLDVWVNTPMCSLKHHFRKILVRKGRGGIASFHQSWQYMNCSSPRPARFTTRRVKSLWYALDTGLVRLEVRCGAPKEINVSDSAGNRTPISRSRIPQTSHYAG